MLLVNGPIKNRSKAIGLVLMLFVVIYAPVSAAVSRIPLDLAVPLTIVLSLGVAIALIAFFMRRNGISIASFGFGYCSTKHAVAALVIGLPLGFAASWLTGHAHEAGPLEGLSIPVWLSVFYFGFGAPVQEEVIFRGLLQNMLTMTFASPPTAIHAAPFIVAVLFGAIHLVVGPVTAICAFVLGMVAGEFRLRSGSLIPAIFVHALFNLCGIVRVLS
jgi:membrane protease YdiL (CAAX protease family)